MCEDLRTESILYLFPALCYALHFSSYLTGLLLELANMKYCAPKKPRASDCLTHNNITCVFCELTVYCLNKKSRFSWKIFSFIFDNSQNRWPNNSLEPEFNGRACSLYPTPYYTRLDLYLCYHGQTVSHLPLFEASSRSH